MRFDTIPNLQKQLPKESDRRDEEEKEIEGKLGLHDRVTSDDISKVVAKATGIPVQNLLKGERDKLVRVSNKSIFLSQSLPINLVVKQMEDSLRQRVVGQDHVVAAISNAVRISRAGLQAPNRPVASFLFLGPTGVGKVRAS